MRLSTLLRNSRAISIITTLDAAATAGTLKIYSGGQPDPDKSVSGIPAHNTGTAYSAGNYVTAGAHYYRAENGGTSAGTVPTWPTNGGTIVDGGVTWQDMGETPTHLGTLTLSKPCGTVTNGVLTFDAIAEEESAQANGTASWARFSDGDGNAVLDASVGLTSSGADFIINTTTIITGGPIRIADSSPAQLIEPGA